jgi:hypothetical protein
MVRPDDITALFTIYNQCGHQSSGHRLQNTLLHRRKATARTANADPEYQDNLDAESLSATGESNVGLPYCMQENATALYMQLRTAHKVRSRPTFQTSRRARLMATGTENYHMPGSRPDHTPSCHTCCQSMLLRHLLGPGSLHMEGSSSSRRS